MNYSNLTGGLRIQSQIPLDVKEYSLSENDLKNLGTGNNLAFTYTKGLVVYCVQEGRRWEWREVKPGEENTGLLSNDFVYPDGVITFGINYGLKSFNFFPYVVDGQAGQQGEQGIKGDQGEDGPAGPTGHKGEKGDTGENGINGADGFSAYELALQEGFEGTETEWLFSLAGAQGPQGEQGSQGVDASNNLQKTIDNNYILSDLDNNYTILVNNGSGNIKISYPGNLIENFCVAFIQQGTGMVEIENIGIGGLFFPVGRIIKGENYNAYLEQIGTTGNAHLIGNLKP